MNPPRLAASLIALFLAGCAQIASVTVVKPHLAPGIPKASADRRAEQLVRRALKDERSQPLVALSSLVEAAEISAKQLDRNPADVDARHDYNFAVERIFGVMREAKLTPWSNPVRVGSRTLAWKPHPRTVWNPALYDLIPADQLKIGGTTMRARNTKDGVGAPLVAKRVGDRVHDLAATPHFFYCATGVARFEGSRCILSLEDPLETETTRLGRRTFPLAADYTAPLTMMLVEMHPKELGLPRLLNPAKFAETTRIARLEPYDPNKTVVLVVHGLMSSPGTWFPLINHLRSDEDFRRKYQFWFFSYPSGYPYSYSAAILRKELDQAEKLYPLRKKMVVIGHSMGGCVSRLLITDTGRKVWKRMFTVPPGRMEVTPEHLHILTESTIFSHRPEVGRVIFISSPLRGSNLASGWLGRFMAGFIKLPSTLMSVGSDELKYERQAAGIEHLKRFPDSIDTLDPTNDFVVALHDVPITPGIPYHVIAGDRGRGDAPNSSDGLVPYWSSHLPAAKSEKIVPSDHNAHQNEEAIAEVHRILTLHAGSR